MRTYGGLLVGGAGKLDKLGYNATGVASLLGGAAVVAAIVGVTVPGVSAATMSVAILTLAAAALGIGWGLNWFGRDRTTDALDDVRGAVQERLAALSRPLVVFVDDIDRLEPEQIRLVIRQIKANASLPNINFVLLFQPSIVEEALRPVSAGDGRDYLEKIVQANFDLPPVTADRLLQIFLQQLSAMIDPLATPENGFEQTRWGNVLRGGIEPMIRNLRDSRRLLTSIAIHIEMHKGEHAHEVNIIDFVALEALRVFEPAFHRALSTKKVLLTQSGRFNGDNRQGGDGAEVTALLELVSEARRPACERMLKELFTPIEWALGGMHYGDDFRPDWLRAKRVCTKRYFDRYFALQIAGDVISESDFVQFTQSAGDPAALALMVSSFAERNLLAALANRLDQSVNELPLDNPVPLLALLFGNGEQLGRSDSSPLNDPFVASWRSAIWYLARLPDSAIRRDVFADAFKASDAMAVSAFVLSLEDDALNKPDAGRAANFTVEDLEALKQLWLTRMGEHAADIAKQLAEPGLISRLYRWMQFGGDAAPRAWATARGSAPETVIPLLRGFINRGLSQSWGDLVATQTESFHRQHFDDFVPVATVAATLANVDRMRLTPDDAKVIALFEKHASLWSSSEDNEESSAAS
jgi:hypothetical protein